jgi:hypothetical protein
MKHFEVISWGEEPLVYVIRAEMSPDETTFLTPDNLNFQVGFVVYPAGGEVKRHVHRKIERHIAGTTELIMLKSGRCEIDVYNNDRQFVTTRELSPGDIVLTVSGGHGFRMHEDTVLIEVKQGPYSGVDEKERF